jgi:hypothetical protein
MPAPTGAYVYRDALITVDAVDYTNQINKARLVPDQPIQTYRTLVPDGVVQDVDSVVWSLELTGLQINTSGGLAAYLRTNSGLTLSWVIQPRTGVGQSKATFSAIALMPEYGGEQGAFAVIDMTLPVLGGVTFGTS